MSHNFPCSPQGGKLSQLNPGGATCCIGKTILCKMIRHCRVSPSEQCIAVLVFCHGTQTMHNSRIFHCLLFYERSKQNFMYSSSHQIIRLVYH